MSEIFAENVDHLVAHMSREEYLASLVDARRSVEAHREAFNQRVAILEALENAGKEKWPDEVPTV